MLTPIMRPILQPVMVPVDYDYGGAFNPLSLFAGGEQGFWYDPSDFSTLFQDAAGTIPVTALGQPVGRINDKSGRGNHAYQTTALSRPTLQQDSNGRYYLSFDGTDDGMVTNSIDFTGTNKMTLWAGVRKLSDAMTAIVCELSTTLNTNTGAFYLGAPGSVASNYVLASKGTAQASVIASPFVAPITNVVACQASIATPTTVAIKVNGGVASTSATTQGTGNYGNHPLYIGRRGGTSLPFNGRIYQLIGRGAETPLAQIAAMEQYVNVKTGALKQGGGAADPYWDNVVSLLHFDGADNGTIFTDERGRVWTAAGDAKTKTSLKKWGTAAGDFNGVNSYIRTPHSPNLNVGSDNYTVEAWVYLRAAAPYVIFVAKGDSVAIQLPILLSMDGSGTKVQFGVGIGGAWNIAVSNIALPLNEWVHIAGVRSGGSLLLFQQGVLVGTAAAVGPAMDNTLPLSIGANEPGNSFANVVVDDFRLTISVARYTENFTPPTEPFPTH